MNFRLNPFMRDVYLGTMLHKRKKEKEKRRKLQIRLINRCLLNLPNLYEYFVDNEYFVDKSGVFFYDKDGEEKYHDEKINLVLYNQNKTIKKLNNTILRYQLEEHGIFYKDVIQIIFEYL